MRAIPLVVTILTATVTGQNPGETAESQLRHARFAQHRKMAAASPFKGLAWQYVGPQYMRGRVVDIEAHPDRPETIYVAAASGGVFKTTDEGKSWTAIFADQATASMGDLAIAPTAPDTIWVGTGEANILRSSMAGTGVYKSTDAGKTFAYMGLGDTQHIGRVVVHPKDANIVYVAAAGHEYTHDTSRGVYRTRDGGKTWEQVFHEDEKTGVIDLAIDPEKPEILYACTAERLRYRWNDPKPGPQAGVWQSTDAGDSWKRLEGGLPNFARGRYERIGIDICRSKPETVYVAMHKARGAGTGCIVYRSDDRGKSWKEVAGKRQVRRVFPRFGWFFGQIRVDPNDPDTVYALGISFMTSSDGGESWRSLRGTHVDFHAMWIDPNNSDHVLVGNDGGLMISQDRFKSFDAPRNLPIAQCYNAGVSATKGKFRIYTSIQDQMAWSGEIDVTDRANVKRPRWQRSVGDESGRHVVDPTDPNVVHYLRRYGGGPSTSRGGGSSGRGRGMFGGGRGRGPSFDGARKRAQWVSPLVQSPHDHERLLYGAQFVFLTDDGCKTWKKISPDLTNFDETRQGNIPHAVVFAIAESPVEKGVIWAGTDDGNIQLTRDEGKSWQLVAKIPRGLCVSSLAACAFDKGTIYATVNGKRHDDFGCYVLRSTNYGKSWDSISAGIPGSSANVIKQDPKDKSRLFVGTDRAVYVTTDGGRKWHVLGSKLPTVYVHDLVIQEQEDYVVIATHGRGCFILDVRELRKN